jgi:hypothetical protein
LYASTILVERSIPIAWVMWDERALGIGHQKEMVMCAETECQEGELGKSSKKMWAFTLETMPFPQA